MAICDWNVRNLRAGSDDDPLSSSLKEERSDGRLLRWNAVRVSRVRSGFLVERPPTFYSPFPLPTNRLLSLSPPKA